MSRRNMQTIKSVSPKKASFLWKRETFWIGSILGGGGGGGGGGGVTTYISEEYGDVRALLVYFSALPLYDKVCFSASNYMNSPSFHSSHYFNSPLNLQFRHKTNSLRILFLEPIELYQKAMFFMSNYMNRYGFKAWPLYE